MARGSGRLAASSASCWRHGRSRDHADRSRACAGARARRSGVMRALASQRRGGRDSRAAAAIGEQFEWDTGAFWKHDLAANLLRLENPVPEDAGVAEFWASNVDRGFERGIGLQAELGFGHDRVDAGSASSPRFRAALRRMRRVCTAGLAFPRRRCRHAVGVLEFSPAAGAAHRRSRSPTQGSRGSCRIIHRIAATQRIREASGDERMQPPPRRHRLDGSRGVVTAWNRRRRDLWLHTG